MSKFCKYCGKQLADNENCDCVGAQAEKSAAAQTNYAQPPVYQVPKKQSFFSDFVPVLKSLFLKPADGVNLLQTKKNYGLAGVFAGITAIFTLIFVVCYGNSILGGFTSVPFGKGLLSAILICVVSLLCSIGVKFILHKIFNKEANSGALFLGLFAEVSLKSALVSAIVFISSICALIDVIFGFVILLFAIVLWFVFAVSDAAYMLGESKDEFKNIAIVTCLMAVAAIIIVFVTYKLIAWSSQINYGAFSDLAGMF